MTLQVHQPPRPDLDRLAFARQVVRGEAAALEQVANHLGEPFLRALELLERCPGRVCVTGTGKSADVGQKIAGTLNSTGTRAYVLDATKAVHGDLGMVHPDDIVLALSHSGESEEIVRLLPSLKPMAHALIGVTSNAASTLALRADVALVYGPLDEVCPLGLAPSTSTTVMIALGDALAFVLLKAREFTREDFAKFHPAGSLGRKLLKVEQVMRTGSDLRLAESSTPVRGVFAQARRGRRTGAVMLIGGNGQLAGIFTDSDLARLFEQRRDNALDEPIERVMTAKPTTVTLGSRLVDAVELMKARKISELPVVDDEGRPVGLIDITDVIGLLSREEAEQIARVA